MWGLLGVLLKRTKREEEREKKKLDGDEIELDIEVVDVETLWELDRLVNNFKKMVSKIKRQALMDNINNRQRGKFSTRY